MPNILQVAIPTATASVVWPARSSGVNSLLFINQDLNNTIWIGQQSSITAAGPNTIPIVPNGTFSGDASSPWYVIGSVAGTQPLVVVPNGQAYFLGLTQGMGNLVIPSVQSPNFVHDVSGWQIAKDGSAEFNNLTIRGTFFGTDFIINSSGLFFYSSTPALNNLVKSITIAAGTDAEGNAYLAGDTSYGPDGGTYQALNISSGQINWFSATTMAGPWTEGSGIDGRADVFNVGAGTGGSGMQLLVQQDLFRFLDGSSGMDWTPTTGLVAIVGGSDETWHYPALNSPFKSQTNWQKVGYKLMPDNTVWIMGVLNLSTGTSWSGTIFTLPSGYIPASQCGGACGAFGPTADGTPYMVVGTTGAVTLGPVPTGTTAVIVDFRFPLDGTNA